MTDTHRSTPPPERFAWLVQQCPLPIVVVALDRQYRLLFANPAALALLTPGSARLPDAAAGLLFEGEPGSLPGAWSAMHRVLAEGPYSGRWRLGAPAAPVDVWGQLIDWEGVQAVQLTLAPVKEPSTLFEESLYREMFRTNPAVKLLVHPQDGRIIDANPAAAAFYGYPEEVLKRLNIADINSLPASQIKQRMSEAANRRQLFFEFTHRTASGELRDVHVFTGPATVGGQDYLHSIIVDVTAEKRYAAQLEVYHELFRNLPVGVYRCTEAPGSRFTAVNPRMLEIFEADTPEQLYAADLGELYCSPTQRHALRKALLREGRVERRLVQLHTLKGRAIWAEITARRVDGLEGGRFFDGVIEDVTARVEAEVLRDRLTHLLDASPDIVSITDREQRVVYLNPTGRRLLGVLPECLPEAMPQVHPEWAHALLKKDGIPSALSKGYWQGETAVAGPDGEIPVSQLIVSRRLPDGELDCIATIMRDISETKRYQKELEYLAGHDPLTGAYSRGRFNTLLEHERAQSRRMHRPLSLIMFDIDHFKRVNDGYGHDVGDEVLKQIVITVSAHLRDMDVLARWGGEEFLVMLPDSSLPSALAVAERLRHAIETADFAPVPRVTSSFGVATIEPDEAEQSWLHRLDTALYKAKSSGRNRVCAADAVANEPA